MVVLRTNKELIVSGNIQVGDDESGYKNVVYMNARLSTEGGTDAITQSVQDKALYNQNKSAIRLKINEFIQMAYDAQDSIIDGETVEEEAAEE